MPQPTEMARFHKAGFRFLGTISCFFFFGLTATVIAFHLAISSISLGVRGEGRSFLKVIASDRSGNLAATVTPSGAIGFLL